MPSPLENLSGPGGSHKQEAFNEREFDGIVKTGLLRLNDAKNTALAIESRFDLAYNAAHALALAALRKAGYRPAHRYIVFQVLPHTLGLGPDVWRVLAMCRDKRNVAEYEGLLDVTERVVTDLIVATQAVADAL